MLSFVCVDEALAFVVDLACVSSSLNFKLDLIEVLGGVNAVVFVLLTLILISEIFSCHTQKICKTLVQNILA